MRRLHLLVRSGCRAPYCTRAWTAGTRAAHCTIAWAWCCAARCVGGGRGPLLRADR